MNERHEIRLLIRCAQACDKCRKAAEEKNDYCGTRALTNAAEGRGPWPCDACLDIVLDLAARRLAPIH